VTPEASNAPITTAPPTQVVVYDFAVSTSDVQLNSSIIQRAYRQATDARTGQDQLQVAHETAHALAQELVQQLSAKGLYAVNLPRGTQPPQGNILIIDGQFVNINQGNQLRRSLIGLGAGESSLSTDVQIFQSTRGTTEPILEFAADANSGQMPGAAITGAPGAAIGGTAMLVSLGVNIAATGVKDYRSQVSNLADMIAKKIVQSLSNYYATQGWPTIPQ
jgi:hypothetical protein